MKYLAAYLLLNAAGTTPTADSIKTVLESVGIEVEDEKASGLLTVLEGKSVSELIAEGSEKLSSVPAATGAAPAGASSSNVAEEETAAEEAAEESDDDMGFGLFD